MTRCAECGTPLQPGVECRSLFDELLALEWQVEGTSGELVHFLAVSSYVLQHPRGMEYRQDALDGVRVAMRDVLDGHVSIADLRTRMQASFDGDGRVRRAEGEAAPSWPGVRWDKTVRDVLDGGPDVYRASVAGWARSAIRSLDALEQGG